MGKLKVLPPSIANIIAAGEVVQRPSSVVKELMENAVDAGASRVDVVIADSGRTLIQVMDNGCGMSQEDAVLCFERHATSKIASAQDLENLGSYGFRGEALPSIAAVSEITLKTRKRGEQTGTQVTISDFGKLNADMASCPEGSNFQIRNLFYNTPARRKFLKSDNVEFRHIVDEFTRVALTRPDISFSLKHNGRDVFVLKNAKSLKFRILDLMGSNVAEDVMDFDIKTSTLRMSGFTGRPETAKKTLGNQFFFVNGRYFRSPYFHKAVMKAYEELIPDGLTPSYFIFLEIDPSSIDVNISPTKTEIKFEDDSLIFQSLYACIHETIGHSDFSASLDFESSSQIALPQIGRSFQEYKGSVQAPEIQIDHSYNPFEPEAEFPTDKMSPNFDFSSHIDKRDDYGKLFEQKTLPTTQILIAKGKYIITQAQSGLMAVNIRRAWERIIYEEALGALKEEQHITQVSLFPVQMQVGVSQRLILDENEELLRKLGVDISAIGEDTIVVNGVPEGYNCQREQIEEMVQNLLLILSDGENGLEEMMRQNLARKFSVLGASNAKEITSPLEAQRLLDKLFSCDNSEVTSTGKRIVAIIPIEELDKKF